MPKRDQDHEVEVTIEGGRAVVDGKTSISFQKFVQLILQRKVVPLFKSSGDEPIIVGSDLLTNLASAPQDSQENRNKLIMVTLGVGILAGIFVFAVAQLLLISSGIQLSQREYLIIVAIILGLVGLAISGIKLNRRKKSTKIADAMESVASLLSK